MRKNILITGGLGMIGSTLAIKLVQTGHNVTLSDAFIKPYGSNMVNIKPIKDKVTIERADIRDTDAMSMLVRKKDIIFNLAGQVSHNEAMTDPFLDTDINYTGHINVLECVRKYNPETIIFHAGTRLQYGRIDKNPVSEDHPLRPRTPYGVNKSAAEMMYGYYHDVYGIRSIAVRIANPYGPRSQMKHSRYSMVNWFIRQAMEEHEIQIFGDGSQLRDYIYVEDLADAMIALSLKGEALGKVFNIGSGKGISFITMAETVIDIVGRGRVHCVSWPDDYTNIETGDYWLDINRISNITDWIPVTNLSTGIEQTVKYYTDLLPEYL